MTDQELIARLREGATWDDDVFAANRIEELVSGVEGLGDAFAEMAVKREATEAKLAKAVEALREIEADCDADYPPSHGAIKYAIRTVLSALLNEDAEGMAELEGKE